MGTYGVTHIKKDNKIITLSDSYDGYMSGGMGQSNIECIKHFSTSIMKKLFDQYTASSKVDMKDVNSVKEDGDNNSPSLSGREIKNVINTVKEDTQNNEAIEFITNSLSHDIRTSVCGFIPLLYLNINPHYGRDYNYCDYLVDLDNETFVAGNLILPFETIRKASANKLAYFCEEDTELLPKSLQEYELSELIYEEASIENAQKLSQIVQAYFNIDENTLKQYFDKAEQERLKYIEEANKLKGKLEEEMALPTHSNNDSYGAYSIHSCNLNASQLRKYVHFIQQLTKTIPETQFLIKNCEWGLDETYQNGGIRLFSPMENLSIKHEIHNYFINVLEYQFKFKFNIFSTSGSFSSADEDDSNDDNDSFSFFEKPQKPVLSILSLDKIKEMPDQNIIFEELHPYLCIHGYYDETKELFLNSLTPSLVPAFWVYAGLINQDIDVFIKAYSQFKNLSQFKGTELTKVNAKFLLSLQDGIDNNEAILEFAKKFGKSVTVKNSDDFINQLKATTFFEDVKDCLNKTEKSLYLGTSNQIKNK